MRRAPLIELTDDERQQLTRWSRGRTVPARLVDRAKIVLHAAEGRLSKDIARELGIPEKTICKWRNRFASARLAGIEQDAPRGGRKPTVRSKLEATILQKTTKETPPDATQWSVRSMADAVGASKSTVQRVWRDNGLRPHRTKTFKVSNDPQFAEKLVDIGGPVPRPARACTRLLLR